MASCGTSLPMKDSAKKLSVATPDEAMLSAKGMKAHSDAYCNAIREFHAQGKMARNWLAALLIRHTAYHVLDHAWEMEDKDLTTR